MNNDLEYKELSSKSKEEIMEIIVLIAVVCIYLIVYYILKFYKKVYVNIRNRVLTIDTYNDINIDIRIIILL